MLRIGTDCSGIEAPTQALKELKIPYRHIFSSDIDKYVIQSIKANYHPEIIFGDKDGPYPEGDITKRDKERLGYRSLRMWIPMSTFLTRGKKKGI